MDNVAWIALGDEHEYAIRAVLNMIRSEMDRMYWNANQKEMVSPFDNTGAEEFKADVFTVRSYNWDENILPNFETDDVKIWWYKHSNRGVYAKIKNGAHAEDVLFNILYNSIKSLQRYFKDGDV